MTRLFSLFAAMVVFFASAGALGADWPQYRCDAGRTAASAQSLPADLYRLWVRELPTPQPAFPTEIRLRYDATYEPVVMGKTMFVPSMVTDSMTALDTETGKQRWQFFTEGPVRLAPIAFQGKVYFVSDDGYLYCVGAAGGELLWRFRGQPDDGEDRKVMGNGRLVSVFPARGGPVLADGIIYFAAGIWSGEGVFVHALNAETGQVVWSNTDSDRIAKANADHGVATYAGISPQGHLAIVDDTLIVPCGAQLPALLDLKTGKLQTYTMGWGGRNGLPKGCAFVCGTGKYLMHGGDLYGMGRPEKESSLTRPAEEYNVRRMIHPGALTRLQIERTNQRELGDFREPVLTPEAMYYQQNGIVAYDLTQPGLQKRNKAEVPEYRRRDVFPDPSSVVFPELWKLPSKSKVHIKAGNRLYAGRPGIVEAVDIPGEGGSPEISWRGEVNGTPHRMLAADGKLFVVTREGQIYAFGGTAPSRPVVHKTPDTRSLFVDAWTMKVADILEASGTTDGYVLILGLQNVRLVEEIVRQSRCDVIVVDADTERVATLRRQFLQAGLYGKRVSVFLGDPTHYAFPPYMASLILSGDPGVVAKAGDPVVAKSLYRTLRPYGGTVCLEVPAGARQASIRRALAGALPGGTHRQQGDFVLVSREGALLGTADWSHSGADAANTGASQDRLKAPLTRLWFDGSFRWHRKPGSATVRVAGGRILVTSQRSPTLHAVDAYTGRHLWQAALPPSHGDLVALEDVIYIASGNSCVVLDPATGKKSGQIDFPGESNGRWSSLRVAGEFLVGASGKRVVCIERNSGRMLWDRQCDQDVRSIALGGGKVFCAGKVNRRRGETRPKGPDGTVTALDARTGKLLWKRDGAGDVRYSVPFDMLAIDGSVYRGEDGSLIWGGKKARQIFMIGDKLLSYGPKKSGDKSDGVVIRDLLTGKTIGQGLQWVRRGCTILRGSSGLLTTRYLGNAAYVDLASGKITSIWNVRAACSNNLYPADGVLNAPNLSGGCSCNYMPISQGFLPSSALE